MQRFCVYQGTFNPVHKEHIEVAKYAHDNLAYQKIVFIPAFRPPHKDTNEDISPEHRYNMLKLAILPYEYCEISNIEYKRNEPSYTYYTIKELLNIHKMLDKIDFIIGTDAFEKIESWHKADELKKMINFILFKRGKNINTQKLNELKSNGYSFQLIEKPFIDISSSDIRNKVIQNKPIYDIVPLEVVNYIEENGIYKN